MALVVLDAANVATITAGNLQIDRVRAALDYFARLQLRCVAFAPRYWLDGTKYFQDEGSQEKVRALVAEGKLVLTPPQAHDDYYVIDYAIKHDGFVVTNDMFRDHCMQKRRFHGQVLTSTWVKSHCIDFTFVVDEFLPNSQLMDKVQRANKSGGGDARATPTPVATTDAAVPAESPAQALVDESDDTMMVDDDESKAANASNTRRRVDLSEAVYIQIPMDIVELLHANDDAGLKHFMDMSGTYITLGKAPPRGQTNVTLCIHGSREHCEIAMHAVHAFLHDYVAQQQRAHEQALLQQQAHEQALLQQQAHEQALLQQQAHEQALLQQQAHEHALLQQQAEALRQQDYQRHLEYQHHIQQQQQYQQQQQQHQHHQQQQQQHHQHQHPTLPPYTQPYMMPPSSWPHQTSM
ncbi:hypothetical protein SPRG_07424 [Saprolegnia parasitica CBS 223.65]|uniref:RNase NYN domain-containing protein n=1 Tax=Saprolegnia parasitica (strain CBS 223.65) TaxID=695850 RepID=A0A067CKX4_SAPPC|nr:hypothetical protein SPRG_07424 [Saprolegnia parasitica CBS 223.65]KDO27176.1 hypothetical protein SPRG_07424 [Saprolegnia parasitica CBS 223.65]|eukprot:XP_012201955.1 hypothetical protein SPRG_07424 [Saprolegnia parasitica CBS 223.65]